MTSMICCLSLLRVFQLDRSEVKVALSINATTITSTRQRFHTRRSVHSRWKSSSAVVAVQPGDEVAQVSVDLVQGCLCLVQFLLPLMGFRLFVQLFQCVVDVTD